MYRSIGWSKLKKADKLKTKIMEDLQNNMEVQGCHRTLFYRQPSTKHISSYSAMLVHLEAGKASPKKVTFDSDSDPSQFGEPSKKEMIITLPAKSFKMVPKGTQTDYRESEAQTLPWSHEIRADKKLMEEFLAFDSLSLEKNFPLGMKEVILIERTRQKLAWENVVAKLRGKENNFKRKSLVGKIAKNEMLFKERETEEINTERIKLSKKLLCEELRRREDELQRRLLRSYKVRRSENDEKIDYWKRQLLRELRKIKLKREESFCKPKKHDIISSHLDKTSELYAPKIRDGENPARGHEVIDIQCRYLKRFHGLKILETHLPKFFEPEKHTLEFEKKIKSNKLKICLKKFRDKTIKCEMLPFPEVEKNIRKPLLLKKPETEIIRRCETPTTLKQRSDAEEEVYQASVLLGKIVKGRAIQMKKFLDIYTKKKTD